MKLLDALYNNASAAIAKEIVSYAGPLTEGAAKDFAEYKHNTGFIRGLRQAQAILNAQRKALVDPARPQPKQET
jgi:hypothetical protein